MLAAPFVRSMSYVLGMGLWSRKQNVKLGASEEELREKRQVEKHRKTDNRFKIIMAVIAGGSLIAAIVVPVITSRAAEIVQPPKQEQSLGIVQVSGTSNRGCGLDQLAMFTPPPPATEILPGNAMAFDINKNKSAKMWGTSFLQYTFTAAGDSSYTILNLSVVDAAPLSETPSWLYSRSWDGCGSAGDRIVYLSLDVDKQQLSKAISAEQLGTPSDSVFDPFSVTKDATFTIKVQAMACETSQEFRLRLTYQKAGESSISEETFGPYEVFAAKTGLPTYEATPAGQKQLLKLTNQSELIKPVAGCLE